LALGLILAVMLSVMSFNGYLYQTETQPQVETAPLQSLFLACLLNHDVGVEGII